ncbi:MAG: hypothetical protein SPJ83_07045 [Helicobacter sp.]|uniref:hypothetical protein n=1 Tax=Helicobacter sp. TaxID=218 RepID=UPI002A91C8AA|nr:hypothetical protein [Helicobacter sp.]MDY5822522.1 hypothetical protein [Helicobacter sp.]
MQCYIQYKKVYRKRHVECVARFYKTLESKSYTYLACNNFNVIEFKDINNGKEM